jgi:hypothetical protein
MRALILIILTAAGMGSAFANIPLPDLSEHRWQHRVLVIDTPAINTPAYRAQAAALLPAWAGLLERDLQLITRDSAPTFRVRLIGKDGGVKLDRDTPVVVAELFALIDAMPMRRVERK